MTIIVQRYLSQRVYPNDFMNTDMNRPGTYENVYLKCLEAGIKKVPWPDTLHQLAQLYL